MKKALFILGSQAFDAIYGEEHFLAISRLAHVTAAPLTPESMRTKPKLLREVELLFSGWGHPVLDAEFLAAAPRLEAVFYGAGSVRRLVSEAFWERGIRLTTAAALNAVPVAEFTLAQILFSLKRGWHFMTEARRSGEAGLKREWVPGAYGSRVGIISLGAVGKLVCRYLQPFDVEILAHDPFAPAQAFQELGVRSVGLDELFSACDVVSLHTPNLPSTRGLIRGDHFRRMKPYATFINTARGDVVRESEMVQALTERKDLWAALDVLAEADQSARAPLLRLPNVAATPHIAGSLDRECRRMGRGMVEELERYLTGRPLRWELTREAAELMA